MPIKISDKTIDDDFILKIEEISGQPFHKCMQCGTCSGACPMNKVMDISPRRIMHLTKFGLSGVVNSANTAWICASCHVCLVRCPRGLDIPKIMEAIRQLTLRDNRNYIEPAAIEEEHFKDMPQIALVSCFRKHTA